MQISTPSKGDTPSLHLTSPDPEKGHQIKAEPRSSLDTPTPSDNPAQNTFQRWNHKIESLAGFEARGITRVLPEERHGSSFSKDLQIGLLWFSANMTANLLAVGFLGPLVFTLGFVDSALCAVFGSFLGSVVAAYMSTWGAQSGNRTMVCFLFSCSFMRRSWQELLDEDDMAVLHFLNSLDRLLLASSWDTGLRKYVLS